MGRGFGGPAQRKRVFRAYNLLIFFVTPSHSVTPTNLARDLQDVQVCISSQHVTQSPSGSTRVTRRDRIPAAVRRALWGEHENDYEYMERKTPFRTRMNPSPRIITALLCGLIFISVNLFVLGCAYLISSPAIYAAPDPTYRPCPIPLTKRPSGYQGYPFVCTAPQHT